MSDSGGSHPGLRRRRNVGKKAETNPPIESFLPDDVVIYILSRLPTKDVLRSRCVCRRWRDLTSTKDFTDLHHRHSSTPMILKDDNNGRRMLDRCWEPAVTRSKIHKLYEPDHEGMVLSHNGLIVSNGGSYGPNYKIYNPVYHHVVNIIAKPRGAVFGVFYHPVHQEYCTLWRVQSEFTCQYKILNLESTPKWRDIRNPPTQAGRFWLIPSISVDKYLYWMVKPSQDWFGTSETTIVNCDIMEYDIEKEEFRVIPCPAPISAKDNTVNVNLVDINGVVSVVQVLLSNELAEINIWTLKDDEEQLWTSSNYIINCDLYTNYGVAKPVAFHGGELVLASDGRLYVCNLKLGTFRKFGQKYSFHVKFLSHVTSLVSLKNCESNVCVVEEDDNNNREKGHG